MKKELSYILVPVDFNAPSVQAFRYAYNLSKQIGGKIVLLNIIQTPGILSDFFSKGEQLVQLSNLVKDKLSELQKQVVEKDDSIEVVTRVERGKPYEKILAMAKEYNARMIVLGENHQGTDANQNLGSTVYQVTLKSPIPVLTLKGNVENMNKRIVVPLDLTAQMRRQLYSAAVYGLNYNAEIHLVSALIGGIKLRDSRIFRKLKQAKQILNDSGIEAKTKLFSRSDEPPYRKVMKYAEEIDAGLILVMTHKEGYTYDNYIGAFAHHIINKSSVPVLSLTAAATNVDFKEFINPLIDPAGVLT
jgi:nucleotide-binding universal stress UspA family protein